MSWLVAETSGIGIIVDAVQSVHFRNARVCAKARVRKTNGVDAVACHARHVQKIPFEHLLAESHSLGSAELAPCGAITAMPCPKE